MIQLRRSLWVFRETRKLLFKRSTTQAVRCISKKFPELIFTPGSTHHNSLQSFLEYAGRVGLSPDKTVYKGTHYEYTVAESLLRLGFSLIRCGRRSDAGIDLIGYWKIPQFPESIPVIAQCKARADSLGPRHVRELEGAYQAIPARWRRSDVLSLLVTTNEATPGVTKAMGENRYQMGFMQTSKEGDVQQFLWNLIATERSLEGVGATRRYRTIEDKDDKETNGEEEEDTKKPKKKIKVPEIKKDIQLTWLGRPISPARSELAEETQKLGEEIVHEDEVEESKKKKKEKRKRAATKKGSTKKPAKAKKTPVKRGPGRPKGSKNKKTVRSGKTEMLERSETLIKASAKEMKVMGSVKESSKTKTTRRRKVSPEK